MPTLQSSLPTYNLAGKRVLLRADLNVPLLNRTIASDYKLKALQPTLDLILDKGGHIILATHIARPTSYDASLSTQLLIPWFEQQGYTIQFQPDMNRTYSIKSSQSSIILLENLRFFQGEQEGDEKFAHSLAKLGDFFVNDAFGSLHRTDTSIHILPYLFKPEERTIGLLIERELLNLQRLINNAEKPLVMFIGGSKIETKLPLLEHFLGKATTILLGPAIVFTLLKGQKIETGRSLVQEAMIPDSQIFLAHASYHSTKVVFPVDYQVERNDTLLTTATLGPSDKGIAIGEASIGLFIQELLAAKTIFFNGPMGFFDAKKTCHASIALLKTIASSLAYSVIAGGDSIMMAELAGCQNSISFLSTGGGSTLAYLSGQSLPGLSAFQTINE
jgi:phosphoglycerate kinase